ncbi:ArnT family glycosyltransferase [Singulisphaera sp. PoT]|uniref:ArnT family glycosyltransferase n=1 Tax=Singulisphaera sp. PoT TaxID=3411797 RepID=UPI003BF4D5AF
MSDPGAKAAETTPSRRSTWLLALIVGIVTGSYFAIGLKTEPSFVDEWAYISQSYYASLFFDGSRDHAAWLDYPAYDLPPLPKYLIGGALSLAQYPLPGPADARKWYNNIKYECGPHAMLRPARIPSAIIGMAGCVALFGIGTLAFDRTTGVIAAALLAINPLYRMHARRAMSDVIAEALIVLSVLCALWAWKRILEGQGGRMARWAAIVAAGVFGGFAALAKLNGGLAMIHVVLLSAMAVAYWHASVGRRFEFVAAGIVAGLVSLATFVAFNPFVTAHPQQKNSAQIQAFEKMKWWERAIYLVTFRANVSSGQQKAFPHNALRTAPEKLETVAVQGFGRFGPMGPKQTDSTRRFDFAQDKGAIVWLPWVLAGGVLAWLAGRRQWREGEPTTGWALLAISLVSLVVVSSYLPLAWDRYFISLQPWSALLGAAPLAALLHAAKRGPRGLKTWQSPVESMSESS